MRGEGVRLRGGKWRLRVTFANGVRREVTSTKTTKREALRERSEIQLKEDRARQRRRLGLSVDVGYTFKDAYDRFRRVASKKKNWRTLEGRFRLHLNPAFGKYPLESISPADVEKFLADKRESGLSPRTCEHLRMHGSLLFTFAMRKERVHTGDNPFLLADRVVVPQKPVRHLEHHHVQDVLDAVDERYRSLFVFAVYTGLRLGELRGLRPEDVNTVQRLITVSRSGSSDTTKTGKLRLVPIPSAALPVVEAALKAAEGRPWLFADTRGEQLSRNFKAVDVLREAMRHAGVADLYKELRFHDLRKTFGTFFYETTGDLRAAAKIMGHGANVADQLYVAATARHLGVLADKLDFKRAGQIPSPLQPHLKERATEKTVQPTVGKVAPQSETEIDG